MSLVLTVSFLTKQRLASCPSPANLWLFQILQFYLVPILVTSYWNAVQFGSLEQIASQNSISAFCW